MAAGIPGSIQISVLPFFALIPHVCMMETGRQGLGFFGY
jgi:hypothetical protein